MPGRKAQGGWLMGPAPGASTPTTDQTVCDLSASAPTSSGTQEFFSSQRLARIILLTVLCGFVAVEAINVLTTPGPSQGLVKTVGIASICVLFTLQIFISSQAATEWPMPRRVGMLLAQALVPFPPV